MTFKIARLLCFVLFVLCVIRGSFAQGCGVVMTRNYSSYESQSTDGTRIYSSVVVDGNATCDPTIECPCNTAVHTPHAYNKLGSVGGWTVGNGTCPACYISYSNNQSIIATHGVNYTFSGETEIICSIAGTFYSDIFNNQLLRIRDSNYIHNGNTTGACIYDLYCPNGNTAATCKESPLYYEYGSGGTAECYNYMQTHDLVINGVCTEVGTVTMSTTAHNCN